MPVFTFEKISPPLRRVPPAPVAEKPRNVIVQFLDRFVEARVKRTVMDESAVSQLHGKPPE
jgi:hypothetical protein